MATEPNRDPEADAYFDVADDLSEMTDDELALMAKLDADRSGRVVRRVMMNQAAFLSVPPRPRTARKTAVEQPEADAGHGG